MTGWRSYHELFSGPAHSVSGDLRIFPRFYSPQLQNERALLVHLPPSYAGGERRYPVIYMMDGQNLFDQATAHAEEWKVDETMVRLSQQGLEAIVVGVENSGAGRTDEYSPFPIPGEGGGRAAAFVDFLVDEVRPAVLGAFRALARREESFLLGSSLGGLVSLFGLYQRPDIFGGAALMSPALWPSDYAVLGWLAGRPACGGRIYLDVGTRELSGRWGWLKLHRASRRYAGAARELGRLLAAKESRQALCYVEEPGGRHHERAWARRLPGALRFLLAT